MAGEIIGVRRCLSSTLAGLEALCNAQLKQLDVANGNVITISYDNRNAVTFVAVMTVYRPSL